MICRLPHVVRRRSNVQIYFVFGIGRNFYFFADLNAKHGVNVFAACDDGKSVSQRLRIFDIDELIFQFFFAAAEFSKDVAFFTRADNAVGRKFILVRHKKKVGFRRFVRDDYPLS